MAWDFETDPEFQMHIDWTTTFLRDEVEPLDLVLGNPYDKSDKKALAIAKPLQERVKCRQAADWAAGAGGGGRGL